MRLVAALALLLATSCAAPVDPDVIGVGKGDTGHGGADVGGADVTLDTTAPLADAHPAVDTGALPTEDSGAKVDTGGTADDTSVAPTDTDVPDFGAPVDTGSGTVDSGIPDVTGGLLTCSKDADCTISPFTCCDLSKHKCGIGAFPLCVSPF